MQPDQHPPAKLPDPWLFDSEALLRELDRCRETVFANPDHEPECHTVRNKVGVLLWKMEARESLPRAGVIFQTTKA